MAFTNIDEKQDIEVSVSGMGWWKIQSH